VVPHPSSNRIFATGAAHEGFMGLALRLPRRHGRLQLPRLENFSADVELQDHDARCRQAVERKRVAATERVCQRN
jgi:hypothetical protein